MMRRDEKGYVMSGIGFLLLIPVMIAIPLALSVQDQSANIPTTFVKSDSVFQTYKNIQVDINDKLNSFQSTVYGVTFNNSCQLSGNISALYVGTQESNYKTAFSGVVDSISITPAPTSSLGNLGDKSGVIPLKNGITVSYSYLNTTTVGSDNIMNYNMTITTNMTVNLVKNNTGNINNFYVVYGPIPFAVNASSSNNANSFFNTLQTNLKNICL